MKSGNGSQQLTRLLTAYLTSLTFGLTFVVGTFAGVDGMTALMRSVMTGGIALLVGNLLAAPVVDAVLTALARDEAKRQAEKPKEDA
jgi:hypothetical protein